MSFYFDDDNDDFPALSQGSRNSVGFSLSHNSQNALPLSQESTLSAPILSQSSNNNGMMSQSIDFNYDAPDSADFVCHNCGSTESYLDETTGHIVCTVCFTQSQSHVDSSQQQFDFDDAMNMAHRSRDGRVVSSQQHTSTGPKKKRGVTAKPLEEYDNSQRQAPLAECLDGFQTVMVEACKVLCRDLMTVPVAVKKERSKKKHSTDAGESQGDKNTEDDGSHDPSKRDWDNNSHDDDHGKGSNQISADKAQETKRQYKRHRKEITRQALSTLRDMWKAYLFSWKEGAEYYAARYPQVRFSLRDQFLNGVIKTIMYKTLAAKATKSLKERIRNESNNDGNNPSFEDMESDGTSKDGSSSEESKSRPVDQPGVPRALILNAAAAKRTLAASSTGDDVGERTRKRQRLLSDFVEDDDSLGNSETNVGRGKHQNESSNRSFFQTFGSNDQDSDNDEDSLASAMSDGAGVKTDRASSSLSNMIVYHMSKKKERGKGDESHKKESRGLGPKLGRKEAALVLPPSMMMIMAMLWISTSSYGVTARHIVKWVRNGSLPLLNAFDNLLQSKQQKALKSISAFFRQSVLPTETALKRLAANLHVACGYKPPRVRLIGSNKSDNQLKLMNAALSQPGRLVKPSNVAVILANMVADLGLSQKVLNYALSIMAYPVVMPDLPEVPVSQQVSRENSNDDEEETVQDSQPAAKKPSTKTWLPPPLQNARPDRLSEPSHVLAVIVAACKMIPSWDQNLVYKMQSNVSSSSEQTSKGEPRHSTPSANGFVPWDYEHFGFIGNGSSETAYLDFLENSGLFSKNVVVPNFSKLLKESREEAVTMTQQSPTLHSNPTVLRFSEKSKEYSALATPGTGGSGVSTVVYRLTTTKETKHVRSIDPPLGAMIEFFCYKTGCRPDKTLEFLTRLDNDLKRSNRTLSISDNARIRMNPQQLLNAVMKQSAAKEEV